jgi:hypothetical protein
MGGGLYLATSIAATAATDHHHPRPRLAKRWSLGNDHTSSVSSVQHSPTMPRANGSSEFLRMYNNVFNILKKEKRGTNTIQEHVYPKDSN